MTLPVLLAVAALLLVGSVSFTASAVGAPSLAISQIPLQVVTPVHPQVLLAIGNSESMDGNLSGAIMVGSGSLGATLTGLTASSSPATYAVPAGFTPPITPANGSGNAPYTTLVGTDWVDNGDSRLNVAKAGVSAILSNYMQNTDFALADYSTSGLARYSTWVYYMSAPGGFTFTTTPVASVGNAAFTVVNPCFNYSTALNPINANCAAMVPTLYSAADLNLKPYMLISATSDNASVNDVLYASGQPAIFVNYGGATLTNNTLAQYNAGNVRSTYPSSLPAANKVTGPTNAGYVPASNQVMYVQRGFGYAASQSANSGNIAVSMTSAGSVPTPASVATALARFTSFLKPETNNVASGEIKASAGQAAMAGLLKQAKISLDTSKGVGACPPQQYVVLISDGLPTVDLAGNAWPPLGSSAGNSYGVAATFNADGSLTPTAAFTNDVALIDTITQLNVLKAAGINTYIIGLGAGVNPALNPAAAATLKSMAMAGGTTAAYPATSPAALVTALNNILISIQSGSLATTQSAVSSKILKTGSVQYQASFSANDTPYQDWTGNVLKQSLDPNTGLTTGAAIWSAQALLDTQSAGTGWSTNRRIVTWDPTLNSGSGAGIAFRSANLNAVQTAQVGSTTMLNYLRGDQSQEVRNSGTLRNRSHILGNSVNSTPQYVGAPAGPFFSTSYFAFITANATRAGMLYIGANDGMLHAFNAATGAEQFAFIPNALLGKISQLGLPLYNQNHQFFVDGSPQTGDAQFNDNSWHTLLVGGENGGGKSIYALDVTTPAALITEATVANAVRWEFTDSNMGFSYSSPQISPVSAAAKFAVFFGNGYNSPSQNPWFYAVSAETGQKLVSIDLCAAVILTSPAACDNTKPNGLSSVFGFNSDGLPGAAITQVYAGDLQGNMWAIDVSNPVASLWTTRLLFQATDSSGNRQPITTSPVVSLHPNYPVQTGNFVMFGTGRLLVVSDLTDVQTQTAYGAWDTGTAVPYTRFNFQQQTTSLVTTATSGLAKNILTSSSTAFNFGALVGWYNDMPSAGQRFFTNPALVNNLFIATLNTPPASACSAIPDAVLLELNFKNGGAPKQPIIDVNNDGLFNNFDQYMGQNPSGVAIGKGYASPPTFLYPPGKPMRKNITLSAGTMASIGNKNPAQRSMSWLQIQ